MDAQPEIAPEIAADAPPPEITGFPSWIKVCVVVLAALVVISAVRVYPVFHDAVRVEKGRRDLSDSRYSAAANELLPLADRYPDSTDLVLDASEAALRSGQVPQAARELIRIEGREVNDEQNSRANGIADQIDAAAKAQGLTK